MNYNHQQENNFPKAFGIATAIFVLLLALSYLYIISSKLPEFGTGGLLVNFGTSEEGMGDNYMGLEEPSVSENANNTPPDKVVPEVESTPVVSQQSSDKSVVTQDVEDAPEVVTKEKVKPTSSTPVITPEKKESKPTVNENALYKGKKNNGSGTGDGTGSVPGNQGSINGSNMAPNYGEGGSGYGLVGLPNRSFAVRPKIEDNGRQSGVVAVEVTVDRNGNVIRARAGAKGTTLPDASLWEKCERAAMGSKFNTIDQGPDQMVGIIPFVFKVR
ncbi:energy transducer TonB family protein [Olivibacter sitiensis]|uniref:energy transducer TonB family protein n=1 Tax=Olivibacter sitiensis TaxID=376470 RepID=UPI000411E537|nr:energy transducer TonB [Olivibacter sitiensis]